MGSLTETEVLCRRERIKTQTFMLFPFRPLGMNNFSINRSIFLNSIGIGSEHEN